MHDSSHSNSSTAHSTFARAAAAVDGTTPTGSSNAALTKYSLPAKIKLCLLGCCQRMVQLARGRSSKQAAAGAAIGNEFSYVVRAAGVCAWHVVPLTHARHGADVNIAAAQLLAGLRVLDPSFVDSVLWAVAHYAEASSSAETPGTASNISHGAGSASASAATWAAAASDPRVLKSYAVGHATLSDRVQLAPGAMATLHALAADKAAVDCLRGLLQVQVSVAAVKSSLWVENLQRWKLV